MADVAPSVSTDRSRLMIAPFSANCCVPIERSVVTTAGIPVGIAEIARLMPRSNICSADWSRYSPMATMSTSAAAAAIVIAMVSWSSCLVSGVFSCSTCPSMFEMAPISVCIPVPVTTISPLPRVTVVFMKAMFTRSPSGTSSAEIVAMSLSTGALSPVKPASSICNDAALISRPSAGTLSPASKVTMSPGTSSSAGVS